MKWNVFDFFRKKGRLPFTDSSFVKLEYEPDAIDAAVLEEVDRVLAEEKDPLLSKTLPWATFKQAETLIDVVLASGETLCLVKLSIARFDNKGQPTIENEIFAVDVVLDGVYSTILDPLIDSSLQSSEFAEFAYEDKRNYFENIIYPAYTHSLGIEVDELPSYPEQVVTSSLSDQIAVEEALVDTMSSEEAVENSLDFLEETHFQDSSSSYKNRATPLEIAKSDNITNTYPFSRPYKNLGEDYVPHSTLIDNMVIHFPSFSLFELVNAHYEPYEVGYVEWRLNQERVLLNEELKASEVQANQFAQRYLQKELQQFEQEKNQKIQQKLNRKDKRSTLKDLVRQSILSRKIQEEEKERSLLQKTLDAKIAEAKHIYEAALSKAAQDFERDEEALISNLNEKYFQLANQEYHDLYAEATTNLHTFLEEELQKASLEKANKAAVLSEELSEKGEALGRSLFEQAENYLESVRKEVQEEHRWASQLDVIARLEKLKDSRDMEYMSTIESLIKENKQIRAEQQHALEESLESRERSIADREAAILGMLKQQGVYAEKKPLADTFDDSRVGISSIKSPNDIARKTSAILATLCFLLVGVGSFAYDQSRYATAQEQRVLDIQQEKSEIEAAFLKSSQDLSDTKLALETEKSNSETLQAQFQSKLDAQIIQINVLEDERNYLEAELYRILGYIPCK